MGAGHANRDSPYGGGTQGGGQCPQGKNLRLRFWGEALVSGSEQRVDIRERRGADKDDIIPVAA